MKILQKIFYGLALLLIPLAIILDRIGGVPQPLLFFLAAVAIFPLAALLVHATEQLAGALLDWLTHHANILAMNGESFRFRESRGKKEG